MSAEYDYSQLKSCGEGVFISRNVEIRRPHLVSIGSHVAIDTGFYCTTSAELGDYLHIGPYVCVIGGAESLFKMGNFCTCALGSKLICATDEHAGEGFVGSFVPPQYRDRIIRGPIVFEDFAAVAVNSVILPGVTLGEGSLVAGCSLVTKDTEPWTVYMGIPARPVKKRRSDKILQYAREMGYVDGPKASKKKSLESA